MATPSARASGVPGPLSPRPASRRRPRPAAAPLVVVEDGKARRHAGLEREALQQPLAEGVDGLHLEAAGRLDGDGEELAGALQLLGRRARGRAASRACLRELRVGRGHPFGQPREHALRHLGGGRLGVGERQDALGRRAREQQAQHAHGEHVRLASAGVGADPRGGCGVGGRGLVALRLGDGSQRRCSPQLPDLDLAQPKRSMALTPPPRSRPTIRPRGRDGRRRHSGTGSGSAAPPCRACPRDRRRRSAAPGLRARCGRALPRRRS